MDKVKQFFEKIGYSDILDKLKAEDSDPVQIAEDFNTEFTDVIKTKNPGGVSKEEEEKIFKKIRSSLFQKVKTRLALSEVGNVKEYDDVDNFVEAVKKEIEERSTQGDEQLREKLTQLTDKYNSSVSSLEELQGKLSEKENEFVTYREGLEQKIKAERIFNDKFSKVKFGVSDAIANDYKQMWWNEVENRMNIADDGAITDKDGQFIVIDGRKVSTIDEWIDRQVESRGLSKKNNGQPAGGFSDDAKVDAELRNWVEEARKEGISEETIKRYVENRKVKQE